VGFGLLAPTGFKRFNRGIVICQGCNGFGGELMGDGDLVLELCTLSLRIYQFATDSQAFRVSVAVCGFRFRGIELGLQISDFGFEISDFGGVGVFLLRRRCVDFVLFHALPQESSISRFGLRQFLLFAQHWRNCALCQLGFETLNSSEQFSRHGKTLLK
jgi:hypothetical protein